ncbi:3-dehydroquinate synthase [Asticcacaulis sp. ZE23SCel15]|uniref:3-dehydroquinate synthase n=1 Tax=Asticcacaulis sp. ZE23SCel15 TaxID=3059027 RepID=UPI00265DA452|nr:3-dehydroquinate synthase [Asticcacaulis sp. ZE23SCel15]WKL56199.1 3-dehydroquinate synthase [Asticcacaulis sp. ZE23SCel15]
MTIIPVAGGAFTPYDVLVDTGLVSDVVSHVGPYLKNKRVLIVCDANVDGLHADGVVAQFEAAGFKTFKTVVPAGEQTKSWEGLETVTDAFVDAGLDRKDVVIALGGGVIGDLTGFAASIYMRGIDFIQIPTTVLAQVDSSVGGKTAIDHPRGKNLIGAFHQPRKVLCDLDVLSTLPAREIKCGYAEVIKYGLLGDKAFFEWLEINDQKVLSLDTDAIKYAVARSVEMKAEIVAADEREGGKRALLNLGHTFGHALEAEVGFGDTLLHGEAVGIGMAMAFRYSARAGLCPKAESDRAVAAIAQSGLPTTLAEIRNAPFDADRLIEHMGHDKKAEGGKLVFVLARAIGEAFVAKDVPAADIYDFLLTEGAMARLDA